MNGVSPDTVRVELYADGLNGDAAVRQEMTLARSPTDAVRSHTYSAVVSAGRPVTDYTARIVPQCDGLAVPLESGLVLWQK